jgi:hypothetical protein
MPPGTLDKRERGEARDSAVQAALLGYRNRDKIHYTQGGQRWEGIAKGLNARQGEFPRYADCSSFATWCLWNGMYLPYRESDTVNGAAWKAGYTGTLLEHGRRVASPSKAFKADLVLYGRPGTSGAHVAIVVGRKNGQLMVVSHGSEGGPYYIPYNYRSDIICIRRYIRKGI